MSLVAEMKELIDSPVLGEEEKISSILRVIAKRPESLLYVLQLINAERLHKKEVMTSMNLCLSKAQVVIEDVEMYDRHKDKVNKEIIDFYKDHSNEVGHCFMEKNILMAK